MDFVILIALISIFPNVYRAELPLPSCPTEKPFRMDDSICSSFKEVCNKPDSSQCKSLLNACSQCPPSEYTVSMLATLNMKINELSNLTKKDISDLSSMMKKDISGLSNLTKKDISDLSSMMMNNISELTNLTKKNLSELYSIIKKSISDLSIMKMNISELFSKKKEMNDAQVSAMKRIETILSNHHSWLVGLLFGELIIIVIMIIITQKNQWRLTEWYKMIFKQKNPTRKVKKPLIPDENMGKVTSEFEAMLKAQEDAIDSRLNSKLDEMNKFLTEKEKTIDAKLCFVLQTAQELNSNLDKINKSMTEKEDAIGAKLNTVTQKTQEDHLELDSKLDRMKEVLTKNMDGIDKKLNSTLDEMNKFMTEKLEFRIPAIEEGAPPQTVEDTIGVADEDILSGRPDDSKE